MTHARRIKPKNASTKEMLEGTVSKTAAKDKTAVKESKSKSKYHGVLDEALSNPNPIAKAISGVKGTGNKRVPNKSGAKTAAATPISTRLSTRRKFLKRLSYLAIFCVLAFALLSLSFRTEEFVVQGNKHLSDAEVQALSKIHAGTPLLWVSQRNVKNLLRNPWIYNVKINREFPHTVLIELSERTPVALLSIGLGEQISGEWITAGLGAGLGDSQSVAEVAQAAYAADQVFLPDVPVDVLNRLTPISGWGEDRAFEGLELLNYLNNTPELNVTKIDFTPEGFEASFNYGLLDTTTGETSFILGQLQTPHLTLLKEHWSAFLHALTTSESSGPINMAGSLEDKSAYRLIVPAPQISSNDTSSNGIGNMTNVGQEQDNLETGRIVKRKWITVYGWGVSLSE